MSLLLRNTLATAGLLFCGAAAAQSTPGACTPVLLDNGTFVTSPNGGAGGAPVSVVTAPDTTFGASAANVSSFSVAEDFTVPAAGWNVSQLTVYTYQTGSTTTSTINGVPRLVLWNGVPGSGGTVVAGPVAATLVNTTWSGVYRATSTTPTDVNRPIMQVTVQWPASFPTPLAAGTYWLEWNFAGSLASGPWSPPRNADASDNGRQNNFSAGDSWTAMLDTGSSRAIGFPLVVCGGTAPVSLQQFEID